jgi:hypothetical protein
MSANPPVKFSDKIKETSADGSGYPYRIKADDLDKNFVFATLDVPKGWVEDTTGAGGHKQRKLLLPELPKKNALVLVVDGKLTFFELPQSGKLVIGVEDGELKTFETEDCD